MSQSEDFDDNQGADGGGILSKLSKFFSPNRGSVDSENSDASNGQSLEPVQPLKVPKRGKILKYLIYSVVVLGLIGVVIFVYIPQQQQKVRQQSRLAEVGNQSAELQSLKQKLAIEKSSLVVSKDRFNSLKARAYTQKELDRLFGNISYLANEYELLIDRIEQQSRPTKTSGTEADIEFAQIQINLNVSGK